MIIGKRGLIYNDRGEQCNQGLREGHMDNWHKDYLKKQSDANWDRINGGKGIIRWPQTGTQPQQQPKPQNNGQKGNGQR